MDTSKFELAVELIVKEIVKLPANTVMPDGTWGHINGITKREGQAQGMARYFVARLGNKLPETLSETWTADERIAIAAVRKITDAAIAIVGK